MNDSIRTVFNNNAVGTLATVNKDGSPWVTPVHIITDGELVYWFSSESAVHSKNLVKDARVSIVLFSPDMSKGPQAVYISGKAEKVSDEDMDSARQLFTDRMGSFPSHFKSAAGYKLSIGEINQEKTAGNCWYFHS